MRIDYSVDALCEVEAAINFYLAESPRLAIRFRDDLRHAERLLTSNPMAGYRLTSGCRRFTLRHFPYGVIYRLDADREFIQITALAHHSRRPGYWSNRTEESAALYRLAA